MDMYDALVDACNGEVNFFCDIQGAMDILKVCNHWNCVDMYVESHNSDLGIRAKADACITHKYIESNSSDLSLLFIGDEAREEEKQWSRNQIYILNMHLLR